MITIDREIVRTGIEEFNKMTGLNIDSEFLANQVSFKGMAFQPGDVDNIDKFNNYVKEGVVSAFYDSVMKTFNRLVAPHAGDISTLDQKHVNEIKDIFKAKSKELRESLNDFSIDDFSYYNCDVSKVPAKDLSRAAEFLCNSLADVSERIFTDFLSLVNKYAKSANNSGQQRSTESTTPTNSSSKKPVQNSGSNVESDPIERAKNTINARKQLTEKAESITSELVLPPMGDGFVPYTITPKSANVITEIPVQFEQPKHVPSYNDEVIKKHFVIGPNVTVADDGFSEDVLRMLLIQISKTIEIIENDNRNLIKAPLVFGFSKFNDINDFELNLLDENGAFIPVHDSRYLGVSSVNGCCIMLIPPNGTKLKIRGNQM